MTKNENPSNVYYFDNGTSIVARDTQDAFRAFRVAHGATPAILVDTRTMADLLAEAAERSAYNND